MIFKIYETKTFSKFHHINYLIKTTETFLSFSLDFVSKNHLISAHMNTNLLNTFNSNKNVCGYLPPKEWLRDGKIKRIFPAIERSKEKLGFDIFDFELIFNDKKTNDLIRTGKTIGCFYIESPGMRALLRKLDCHTFEMLVAASSIIRPGVAESGMMQEFISRHRDPSKRKYFIPQLGQLLSETYGVMVYQEDVIKVAHQIAGLNLEEADLLRRAMSGKMRSHEAMQKLTKKFFDSCRHNALTDAQSQELWRQIESFAGYSFCKAHSAAFALLSYQVAFLKAHFPAEFMASVLSNGGGFYSPAVYIWEAKRMGLKILLPSVNHSEYEYIGSGNQIRIGLMAIKNLSYNSAKKILSERKINGEFKSLADFIVRTKIGFEETSLLIKCGAMGCFQKTRPELLRLLDIYIHKRKLLDDNYNDLFISESFDLEKEVQIKQNFSVEEICKAEFETFGYMVTKHPLHFFKSYIDDSSVTEASHLHYRVGKYVKVIGWFMSSKRVRTTKGEIMKFLSLEDLSGTFEAVIFPDVYKECAEMTLSMGPYLIEGIVDKNDSNNVIVKKLTTLSNLIIQNRNERDGVENTYLGDIEKISDDDFKVAELLDEKKLKIAYAG
jgi:DNA polymerase III alpha subunit